VPGSYAVRLGNTAKVKVAGGERTTLATGTLAVTGPGKENYALSDESGGYVGGFATGSVKELVPGSYAVRLGNTAKVKVAGGERTTLATGTLEVTGPGKENYALSDESGGYVGGFATGSVKELVTGSYAVKLGNTAKVKVAGGERATLATGTLEVPGTGKENYALSDESGGYVGGYATGSVKELVPGRYTVKLGENSHRVEVVAGGKATLAR